MSDIEHTLRKQIRIIAIENTRLRAEIKFMEETKEALIIEAREQLDELNEETAKLRSLVIAAKPFIRLSSYCGPDFNMVTQWLKDAEEIK